MLALSFYGRGRQIPVLMFHGLCEQIPEYTLFQGGRTCLMPVDDFSSVVQWCCQNYDVVRVSDIDDLLSGKFPRSRPLLLTFDDGLASVIDYGLPVLRQKRLSAVMFVATGITDSGRTPDIFQLERIIYECIPAKVEIEIQGERLDLSVPSKAHVSDSFFKLWSWLTERRFPPLQFTLDSVQVNGNVVKREMIPDDRTFWFPASWDELKAAAREGILEIGSHMVTHQPLPWLTRDKIEKEMVDSQSRLEREFARSVGVCAYPHGQTNETVCEVAGAHYRWAFCDSGGPLKGISQRLRAPRIHVPSEDWAEAKRAVSRLWRGGRLLRFYGGSVLKRLRETAAIEKSIAPQT